MLLRRALCEAGGVPTLELAHLGNRTALLARLAFPERTSSLLRAPAEGLTVTNPSRPRELFQEHTDTAADNGPEGSHFRVFAFF